MGTLAGATVKNTLEVSAPVIILYNKWKGRPWHGYLFNDGRPRRNDQEREFRNDERREFRNNQEDEIIRQIIEGMTTPEQLIELFEKCKKILAKSDDEIVGIIDRQEEPMKKWLQIFVQLGRAEQPEK